MKCTLCEKELSRWDRFVGLHDCRAEYLDKMVDDMRKKVDSFLRPDGVLPTRDELLKTHKEFQALERAAAAEFRAAEHAVAEAFRTRETEVRGDFQATFSRYRRTHSNPSGKLFDPQQEIWGTGPLSENSIAELLSRGMGEAEILRLLKKTGRMEEFYGFREQAIELRSQGESQE